MLNLCAPYLCHPLTRYKLSFADGLFPEQLKLLLPNPSIRNAIWITHVITDQRHEFQLYPKYLKRLYMLDYMHL